MNNLFIKFFICMIVFNSCLAEYKAEIYLNTGALIVDNKIDVLNDKLVLESKTSMLDIKLINNINFVFDNFNNDLCSSLFRSKKFTSLEGLLEEIIPLKKFSNLQSNLFDYYIWLLKSQIWNRNFDDAKESIKFLSSSKNIRSKKLSDLYNVYILLEEDDYINAKKYYSLINESPDEAKTMIFYLESRINFIEKNYSASLEKIAKILTYYSREHEWIPPTLLLELNIYLEKKQYDKALNVINEIKWSYPKSMWIKNVNLLLEKYSLEGIL